MRWFDDLVWQAIVDGTELFIREQSIARPKRCRAKTYEPGRAAWFLFWATAICFCFCVGTLVLALGGLLLLLTCQ